MWAFRCQSYIILIPAVYPKSLSLSYICFYKSESNKSHRMIFYHFLFERIKYLNTEIEFLFVFYIELNIYINDLLY